MRYPASEKLEIIRLVEGALSGECGFSGLSLSASHRGCVTRGRARGWCHRSLWVRDHAARGHFNERGVPFSAASINSILAR
jgi:hypothetical protein